MPRCPPHSAAYVLGKVANDLQSLNDSLHNAKSFWLLRDVASALMKFNIEVTSVEP